MRLIFDTKLIDSILEQWQNGTEDFSSVLADEHFLRLLAHAEDFQQKKLSSSEYLYDLLHIEGIDMRAHLAEIRRNLGYILSVDLEKIAQEVQAYLPAGADSEKEIRICPIIGIGGQAFDDFMAIECAPNPWFPPDGSDREVYLADYVLPTLRHELHHIGFMRVQGVKSIAQLQNCGDLAMDFAQQFQMEGSATLCEKQQGVPRLDAGEQARICEAFPRLYGYVQEWLSTPNRPIRQEDWDRYYVLWGEDKPAYWLGAALCRLLIQGKKIASVAEFIRIEPLHMMQMAQDCLIKGE